MSQTATKKKKPLVFAINKTTGDVHTARQGSGKYDAYYTTCGFIQNSRYTEYESEPVQITCEKCLEAYQTRFVWTAKITIHPTWVMDGFDLTEDRLNDILGQALSCANSDEYEGKILSAPDADEIAMEMGYKNAADRKKKGGV